MLYKVLWFTVHNFTLDTRLIEEVKDLISTVSIFAQLSIVYYQLPLEVILGYTFPKEQMLLHCHTAIISRGNVFL